MNITKPVRILFATITIYLLLTISEVLIHKYIMHNEPGTWAAWIYGDNHNKHHRVVLDDMKLNTESEDHDVGLFFGPDSVLQMTFGFTLPFYGIFKMWGLNVSIRACYALAMGISLFYKFLWDWLHYSFHQIKDLETWKGNPVFYWYFRNHSYHHLVKGEHKGNYNIILPGGDHILGTYRGCIDNTEYCKSNEHSICTRQEENDVLEHGFKFCNKGKKSESVTPAPLPNGSV